MDNDMIKRVKSFQTKVEFDAFMREKVQELEAAKKAFTARYAPVIGRLFIDRLGSDPLGQARDFETVQVRDKIMTYSHHGEDFAVHLGPGVKVRIEIVGK